MTTTVYYDANSVALYSSLPISVATSGGSWYFSLGGGKALKKLGVVENTFGSHTQKVT